MKKIIIFFILILIFSLNVSAETVEKRQRFFNDINSYIDADLKINFDTNLKDTYGNIIQNGDYVCDQNLQPVSNDIEGEWFFNGGQLISPPITWDEQLLLKVRNKIKEILGLQGFNSNEYGKFTDTSLSFEGWNQELQNLVKNVNLYNTKTNQPTDKAAVICSRENQNIPCFLVAGGSGEREFWILAPSNTKSTEFYVFSNLQFQPSNINYTFVGKNPKHGFDIKNENLNIEGNLITIKFELENTGVIPLRIKDFKLTFSNREVNYTEVTNQKGKEINVGEKKEIILKIEKFYSDPCNLFDQNISLKIEYDAPKFKCDYAILGSKELSFSTTEFSKPKFEMESLLLDKDIIVMDCCLKAEQCLVTKSGDENKNKVEDYFTAGSDNQKPKCINSGEYISDYYCQNGSWNSRTKFIALKLLDFVKNKEDYSLFCDSFDIVGNFYDYEPFNKIINLNCQKGLREIPCFNSFCVLKFKEENEQKVLVGLAVNYLINNESQELPYVFLRDILNVSTNYCDNALNQDGWTKCKYNDVWYNPKIEGIIFSNYNFTLNPQWNYENPNKNFLENIESIFSREDDYKQFKLSEIILLDKLFILKNKNKEIKAFKDKFGDTTFIIINYSGFETDFCEDLSNLGFNESCKKINNTYVIFDYKIKNKKEKSLENYWLDLTARIRLS